MTISAEVLLTEQRFFLTNQAFMMRQYTSGESKVRSLMLINFACSFPV